MAKPVSIEICTQKQTILFVEDIAALIGDKCDRVIGQLNEDWGEVLFSALSKGVLTETTVELAASLSLAAARRIVEVDEFMRAGLYDGWLPHLLEGNLLKGQTVGVIRARRIGSAYARMMIEGFKMNLIYYDLYHATRLEKFVIGYGEFLKSNCFLVYLDSHALHYASKLQALVSY
ncbi:hypothetical protein GIB67_002232 [Kingdonia uniflora]|uniref:D-isomer specific 2-hydroxyacid dehydrogenase NAD-binding domain-containing protein n=1 Tax=Kingdonia uniflora TaxID=39325 RepID=A0A7J7KWT9_9MAGN|nr:hypothetical protein GIB67_002232 [Kingdonia uniflora]